MIRFCLVLLSASMIFLPAPATADGPGEGVCIVAAGSPFGDGPPVSTLSLGTCEGHLCVMYYPQFNATEAEDWAGGWQLTLPSFDPTRVEISGVIPMVFPEDAPLGYATLGASAFGAASC